VSSLEPVQITYVCGASWSALYGNGYMIMEGDSLARAVEAYLAYPEFFDVTTRWVKNSWDGGFDFPLYLKDLPKKVLVSDRIRPR
jgi:hypothetical protein